MGSSRDSLCASTSCSVATAVNILFIEPIRNLVAGVLVVPAVRSARPQAPCSSTLPWPAHKHGPGELVSPGALLGMVGERLHRVGLGHPVQGQVGGARRRVGGQQRNPAAWVPADWLETDVVHPAATRPLILVPCR